MVGEPARRRERPRATLRRVLRRRGADRSAHGFVRLAGNDRIGDVVADRTDQERVFVVCEGFDVRTAGAISRAPSPTDAPMITLDVTTDNQSGLAGMISGLNRQLPYAFSRALNATVDDAQEAIQRALPAEFTL